MHKLLHRAVPALLSLLLVFGISTFVALAAGTITLSSTTGAPGSSVTVSSVSGFTANETITINYDGHRCPRVS